MKADYKAILCAVQKRDKALSDLGDALVTKCGRFSAFTYITNDKVKRMVGTEKNVASRELLYAASSDNETFDQRNAVLGSYKNIVTGIIEESEKLLCASEESATDPIL